MRQAQIETNIWARAKRNLLSGFDGSTENTGVFKPSSAKIKVAPFVVKEVGRGGMDAKVCTVFNLKIESKSNTNSFLCVTVMAAIKQRVGGEGARFDLLVRAGRQAQVPEH